jgi:para-aminobenzoate synthetase component 1
MDSTCFFWQHHQHGLLLGIGQQDSFQNSLQFEALAFQSFLNRNKGNYIFGYLSFDVKNAFENLSSNNPDLLAFPLLHYWVPQSIYCVSPTPTLLWGSDSKQNQNEANALCVVFEQKEGVLDTHFEPRTSKSAYFQHFEQLKSALQRGDIYEVNYCQEFAAANCALDNPVGLFGRLYTETKAPHAAYIQTPEHLVLCASPERFLQKTGNVLRSEPIKGTAPRSKDPETDQQLATDLQNNPKERAENIMIVDLVRNDLAQVASKNSVGVDELCQIYSFETVHQMISKISCALEPTIQFIDILKACFPMGSMTGAPKIAALEQIEQHEDFKRGLYSGSIGLIEPNGDFDLNVVIRSLLYNRKNQYLSCSVGSALTIGANAADEYQECLLKAAKLIHGLR